MPFTPEFLARIANNEYTDRHLRYGTHPVLSKPDDPSYYMDWEGPQHFLCDADIVELCKALQTNTHIESLELIEHGEAATSGAALRLGDASLRALATVKTLRELNICLTAGTSEGLREFIRDSSVRSLCIERRPRRLTHISFVTESATLEEFDMDDVHRLNKDDVARFFRLNQERAVPVKTHLADRMRRLEAAQAADEARLRAEAIPRYRM